MSVELDDGRALEIEVPVAKGHPGNPMTWVDMRTKFTALVESTAGSRTQDIFACLRNFGDGSGKGIAVIRHLSAATQA
jgi:2-methylcitrate dehydratase PrpD